MPKATRKPSILTAFQRSFPRYRSKPLDLGRVGRWVDAHPEASLTSITDSEGREACVLLLVLPDLSTLLLYVVTGQLAIEISLSPFDRFMLCHVLRP